MIICTYFDWSWLAGSGDFFFNINTYIIMFFPIVASPDPLGTMVWANLNLHYVSKLYVNMTHFGSVVLEKTIFKWLHPYSHFCDYLPFEKDLQAFSQKILRPRWKFIRGNDCTYSSTRQRQIFSLSSKIFCERVTAPLFEKFWISYTQGWFVQSLIEIGLLLLVKNFFQYKHM
jgi:hypothetical protein